MDRERTGVLFRRIDHHRAELTLNMALWTAFLLGLFGSLHCAGMCGPLALALPGYPNTGLRFLLNRLAYNLGRISTYALLGGLFGLAGRGLALAGLQRSL